MSFLGATPCPKCGEAMKLDETSRTQLYPKEPIATTAPNEDGDHVAVEIVAAKVVHTCRKCGLRVHVDAV